MRGSGPRARTHLTIDVRTFGWDRAVLATLRHSTFAFDPVDTIPLTSIRDLGKRDRLSLLGQFAAHQALLQFAGVADGPFDAREWSVSQKRGVDCRLIRVAGRRGSDDPVPILTIIQQFAETVSAPPLDVLRQTWARAEAVYCEIDARLRSDATADLRWFRGSAIGQIASPGSDTLRSLLAATSGRYRLGDRECIATLRMASDDLVVLGEDASPLERFSGIAPLLDAKNLTESAIVERVIGQERRIFALAAVDSLDAASRKVIDLLQASDAGVWIGAEGIELPDSKWFVISSRLAARKALDATIAEIPREMRRQKLQQFTESPCFARYLIDGVLPAPQMASPTGSIKEPARSYLAALGLLGVSAAVSVAEAFLGKLSSSAHVADLVFEDVSTILGGVFGFVSEDMRDAAVQHLPIASRAALSKIAAETLLNAGNPQAAAALFAEAGDAARAAGILETIHWTSADEAIRFLHAMPRAALSPKIESTLAHALVDAGRYRDAREFAREESLLARIERRTGDYATAIARLERIERTFEDQLLYAELLDVTGGDAASAYDACRPTTDDERLLLSYAVAVLDIDSGRVHDKKWMESDARRRDYYAARFETYEAIASHDPERAMEYAKRATGAAVTMAERIDATLDHLFALFTAGRWREAHAAALDALLIVNETQGDRAAGGILFLLAYLCADDGQCAHASHLLDRLRQFYSGVHDDRRLHELHLISASIELARGHFDAALAAAESLLDREVAPQIREAAALIADEVTLLSGRSGSLRSRGDTPNVELTDRGKLLRRIPGARREFLRDLCSWMSGTPPAATTTSDKLLLLRDALRRDRRWVAEAIASEMGIGLHRAAHAEDVELRTLRTAMTRDFPFAAHDFAPARWRFATRNRLGQWTEMGSTMPPVSLDPMLDDPPPDWIACGEQALLYFEGLRSWSPDSRTALAAAFRTRSEHYGLRRLIEQEENVPQRVADMIEGIVGQSRVIHEICEVVARVAKRDVAVCILGESGTGKELIARAIHRQSGRRQKQFTTINCAALPETLIESELFGSARGAFTGADRDRPGLIETSDGGTLFLDEIGEMPLAAQAKLLRFLQEGEFRRVGDTALRTADVRIVTATNRKLEAAVEEGRFREDLYYRIRGVEILVPPLRDRATDIPLLAAHFLQLERDKHRCGALRLSSDAVAAFASYHWPGNVRELQNAVRAAHAIAGETKQIELQHLPAALQRVKILRKNVGSYQDAVVRFRRDLIEKSLAQANGNQNQAAAMLKISRQALAYQIRELGILVTPSKRPRA